MAVRISLIVGERCDHCDVLNDKPVMAFKFKTPEGKAQLWLHEDCLEKLQKKVRKELSHFKT